MDYTDEQIEKATRNLSREMLEAISSSHISNKAQEIGGRYNLNKNQLKELSDITTDLALGLISKNEFPKILMKLLPVADTIAETLSLDIDKEIFQKINSVSLRKKQYVSLPPDVQEAIISVEVANKLTTLTTKYKLHLDKAEELYDETNLVMLGLTDPKDFLRNLKRRLELPEDTVHALVADINEQIFKPIRESLKRIHGMTSNEQQITNDGGGMQNPKPQTQDHVPNYREPIADEDIKIAKEVGIEFEQPENKEGQNPTEEDSVKRHELIDALENPNNIQSGGISISSGFSAVKNTPIVSPSEKLSSVVKTPATESNYVPTNNPQPTTNNENKRVDPYREPVQ